LLNLIKIHRMSVQFA